MRLLKLLTASVVILVVVACASHRPPPMPTDDKLVVHMLDNGTKLFAYVLAAGGRGPGAVAPVGSARGGRAPDSGPPAMPSGHVGQGAEMPDRQLLEKLNAKLASTGYCREGFVELERFVLQGNQWLRGECVEAATGADRQRYGGRVSLR